MLHETRILLNDGASTRPVRISVAVSRQETEELKAGFGRDLLPGLMILGAFLLAGAPGYRRELDCIRFSACAEAWLTFVQDTPIACPKPRQSRSRRWLRRSIPCWSSNVPRLPGRRIMPRTSRMG